MNKRIPLGMVIAIVCLSIVVTSSITMAALSSGYNSILEGLPEKIERYELIDELDGIINANYYQKNSSEDFELAFAHGYISGLDDNFSQFLTAEEYSDYLSASQGSMAGIGIEYEKGKNSTIVVTNVYEGSPADNSGLEQQDVIIAFDGILLNAANYEEMASRLEGDHLTSVNLTYRRDGAETTVNIAKGYEAGSVFSEVYGGVGYIKITGFYPSTPQALEQQVESFISSSVSGLVLDLRDNSAENYDSAMECLDIFVPMNDSSVPAASVVDSAGGVVSSYSTSAAQVNLPIAILINENTSAAAELFCCNMRDFSKASLVGNVTAGMGLKRDAFRLSTGDAVLLAVGIVKPYRSEAYHGVGITPDVECDLEEKTNKLNKDSQFIQAFGLVTPSVTDG